MFHLSTEWQSRCQDGNYHSSLNKWCKNTGCSNAVDCSTGLLRPCGGFCIQGCASLKSPSDKKHMGGALRLAVRWMGLWIFKCCRCWTTAGPFFFFFFLKGPILQRENNCLCQLMCWHLICLCWYASHLIFICTGFFSPPLPVFFPPSLHLLRAKEALTVILSHSAHFEPVNFQFLMSLSEDTYWFWNAVISVYGSRLQL